VRFLIPFAAARILRSRHEPSGIRGDRRVRYKKRAGVIKDEKLDVAVRNDSFIRKNRDPALT